MVEKSLAANRTANLVRVGKQVVLLLCTLGRAFLTSARSLLVSQPFVDALADELAHVFKFASRLFPELFEHLRIEGKAISASKAFCWSEFVFVVGCELARSHSDYG